MSFGIPFLGITTSGGDTLGRAAFGFGAVIFWCVIAALAVRKLRSLRK
jgi:hypothetical protein